MTIEDTARNFSGHQFEEAFPYLADHVCWHLVGQSQLNGRQAIVEACRRTAAENADIETSWLRFVSTSPSNNYETSIGGVVAVDAIGRYTGPDGVSTVSSCDIYEFDGDQIVRITSYFVELAADDPAASSAPTG